MAWLSQLLSRFADKQSHTYLCQMPHWRIVGLREFGVFFRALPGLLPAESVLCIESTSFSPDVAEYLSRYAISNPEREIQRGTILPRPRSIHIPVGDAVMSGLADISEMHAEPEVADHMVAYHDRGIVLEWYDAGFDPIFVAKEIPEATVAAFCTKIGAKFDELT